MTSRAWLGCLLAGIGCSSDPPAGEADTAPGEREAVVDAAPGEPDAVADVAPSTCVESGCSGHGRCVEGACVCDEGFLGAACAGRDDDFHRRTLLVRGLADPDVLEENDDLFVLTATARSARVIPFYESSDLVAFRRLPDYDPSALDPDHDYCYLWAPDLSKDGGRYELHFSAHRVAQGAPCPPPSGQDVTTFHVSARDLAFGIPVLLDEGEGLPRGRIASGCGGRPCRETVRIDAATFDDGTDRWFFYVWFAGGNNIASYRFRAPGALIENAGPASFAIPAHEERINEAPELFRRGDKVYLFFSGGFFNSQYAMYYVMGDRVADLTRARAVRRHSEPLRAASGRFLETHGHNAVVERRGELFNVFHQGEFDASGHFTGRSVYKQRMAFRGDGSVVALNYVDVGWSRVGDARYSLDVVTRDGTVRGPCIGADRVGTATSVRFRGVCPDAGDVIVPRDEVAAFRVYYSTDGTWSRARSGEVAHDGGSDRAFVAIPVGSTRQVFLRWNELATGVEYSLDVQRRDGRWIAPCVDAAALGRTIEHEFRGTCGGGISLAPADIQAFRVCAAAGGRWQDARCGATAYDGAAGFVDVRIR
jgi:hypothetical protein